MTENEIMSKISAYVADLLQRLPEVEDLKFTVQDIQKALRLQHFDEKYIRKIMLDNGCKQRTDQQGRSIVCNYKLAELDRNGDIKYNSFRYNRPFVFSRVEWGTIKNKVSMNYSFDDFQRFYSGSDEYGEFVVRMTRQRKITRLQLFLFDGDEIYINVDKKQLTTIRDMINDQLNEMI
jgi:hypothetical protein